VSSSSESVADFAMYVAGAARLGGGGTFEVHDPANGELVGLAPKATRDDLDAAMSAAHGALRPWGRDLAARRAALSECARLLDEHATDLAPLLTREQGKPLHDATREITTAAMWFRAFADLEIPEDILRDDESALVKVVRRPIGVVAAITPWNYPVAQASWKLAPALLGGNTVVLKPSPYTPLTNLRVAELLGKALPSGVLNVVTGGDELGVWMTEHPVPRKVSFTGSVATGKRVATAAAPDLKLVTLELGGNDPAIVLGDADPDAVAAGLFAGAFANCGQVCSAIKRVYVPDHLHDRIVDALSERAREYRVGHGLDDGTQMGPLNNAVQRDRVSGLVEDARAQGARIVAGGSARAGAGYFYEPTIVADIPDHVALVAEEQFGPALPVIRYSDEDDVIARANATMFGLSGSVWGTDREHAAAVADQLECGTAWINTHRVVSPLQPFGGAKWSGIGVENGAWGLSSFSRLQVVHESL
jgi:acyl-CoA reductase-like NAD-dependent aldehyde dehydrogenase